MIVLDTGTPQTNPIPPKSEWKNLSYTQMIDLKNRLLDIAYSLPDSARGQRDAYFKGSEQLDTLINAPRAQ